MSKGWYPVIDCEKCVGCIACNVSCPDVPSQYAENWGLDDPSGKSDEVFLETIRQIEKKMLQLKEQLKGC